MKSLANGVLAVVLSVSLAAWFAAPAFADEGGDVEAAAVADGDEGASSGAAAEGGEAATLEDEGGAVSGDAEEGDLSEPGSGPDASDPAAPDIVEILGALSAGASDLADAAIGDRPASVEAPVADGAYLIQPASSSCVLSVSGDGAALAAATGSSAQRFTLEARADGRYVVTTAQGAALDVDGFFDGAANVVLRDATGTDSQAWEIVPNGDGSYRIENYGVYGLTLEAASSDVGAALTGSFAASSALQRFYLVPADAPATQPGAVSEGTYLLKAAGSDLALGMPGYSLASGDALALSQATGDLSQLVVVSVDANGYATLRLANSGLAVAAEDGAIVDAAVAQRTADGTSAQRWCVRSNGDGTVSILSGAYGLALSPAGALVDGTGLRLAAPSDAPAQAWVLEPVEEVLADGVYSLYSRLDNNKAIDTAGGSAEAGALAQLYARNGSPAQKLMIAWTTVNVVDSVDSDRAEEGDLVMPGATTMRGVTIQSLAGGKYLTARADGSVAFENRTDGFEQLWTPLANPAGGIVFVNAASGQALSVPGGIAADGQALATAQYSGSASQSFRAIGVAPIEDGTYLIQLSATDCALEIEGASRENGGNVQVYTPNGTGAQVWDIASVGDGYYSVISPRTGKALDVAGGVAAAGTNVQQWDYNPDAAAQKWRIEYVDGGYRFVSACGGYVLTAAGTGGAGSNVYIDHEATQAGYDSQRFRMTPTTYVHEDFLDLLGTFTTYSTNDYNGTYNMMRALNSFNGVVVQPGQTLSFFAVAGPCGAAQGYLPAGVVGGTGYGGGICQASTTLYGATLRAGMTIVDRQNHSVPSTYVPIGLDAMVNYGTSDYQFRNDLEYPVKIVTYTYGNVLTCEVWGTQPDWYDYIEPESWYTGYNSAAAQRVYYKDGVAVYTEGLPSSWYW